MVLLKKTLIGISILFCVLGLQMPFLYAQDGGAQGSAPAADPVAGIKGDLNKALDAAHGMTEKKLGDMKEEEENNPGHRPAEERESIRQDAREALGRINEAQNAVNQATNVDDLMNINISLDNLTHGKGLAAVIIPSNISVSDLTSGAANAALLAAHKALAAKKAAYDKLIKEGKTPAQAREGSKWKDPEDELAWQALEALKRAKKAIKDIKAATEEKAEEKDGKKTGMIFSNPKEDTLACAENSSSVAMGGQGGIEMDGGEGDGSASLGALVIATDSLEGDVMSAVNPDVEINCKLGKVDRRCRHLGMVGPPPPEAPADQRLAAVIVRNISLCVFEGDAGDKGDAEESSGGDVGENNVTMVVLERASSMVADSDLSRIRIVFRDNTSLSSSSGASDSPPNSNIETVRLYGDSSLDTSSDTSSSSSFSGDTAVAVTATDTANSSPSSPRDAWISAHNNPRDPSEPRRTAEQEANDTVAMTAAGKRYVQPPSHSVIVTDANDPRLTPAESAQVRGAGGGNGMAISVDAKGNRTGIGNGGIQVAPGAKNYSTSSSNNDTLSTFDLNTDPGGALDPNTDLGSIKEATSNNEENYSGSSPWDGSIKTIDRGIKLTSLSVNPLDFILFTIAENDTSPNEVRTVDQLSTTEQGELVIALIGLKASIEQMFSSGDLSGEGEGKTSSDNADFWRGVIQSLLGEKNADDIVNNTIKLVTSPSNREPSSPSNPPPSSGNFILYPSDALLLQQIKKKCEEKDKDGKSDGQSMKSTLCPTVGALVNGTISPQEAQRRLSVAGGGKQLTFKIDCDKITFFVESDK